MRSDERPVRFHSLIPYHNEQLRLFLSHRPSFDLSIHSIIRFFTRFNNAFVQCSVSVGGLNCIIDLRQALCTYIMVFLCSVRWRHSRTPNSEPCFGEFCSTLRKDSIAIIMDQFGRSFQRLLEEQLDVLCNALNDSWLCQQVAPKDSQMCGGNFPKRRQSNADFVPNTTRMVAQISISTRGAQHFALHPVGIALPWR